MLKIEIKDGTPSKFCMSGTLPNIELETLQAVVGIYEGLKESSANAAENYKGFVKDLLGSLAVLAMEISGTDDESIEKLSNKIDEIVKEVLKDD